jgi:diguanylate cyclase (GGDEF)-like protein
MWRLAPVVGLMGAGLAWFALVVPSLSARVALASSLYAVLCVLAVREFHRNGGMAVLTSRYMMLVFGLFAVAMTARIVTMLVFPENGIVLSGGPMEQMTFYNGIVQGILIALGYIILTTERLQQELRAQAALDPLTGIFNRRAFLEAASAHVPGRDALPESVAVLAIDLDHFKRLNDEFGHAVGDRVLQHFVATARRHLRKQDTLARFGGEEFIALLPGVTGAEAEAVAKRLGRAFASVPLMVEGRAVPATASIGVAHLASGSDDLEALLKRADQALYAAKTRGRDQVRRWSGESDGSEGGSRTRKPEAPWRHGLPV